MRCPSCQNENNPPGATYCDICGAELAPVKRSTVLESTPAPATPGAPSTAPAAPNPHQKRRTVFDPGTAAEAVPAAPRPVAAPAQAPRPDFLSEPPPPRPAFDPADPFLGAVRQPAAPSAQPAPQPRAEPSASIPAAAPPVRKARTIIETSGPGAITPRVRGALFQYRGPEDPGQILPLRAGRNSVGRNPDCEVCIEDGRVSGQHAFIFMRAEDATYMDVSTNGSIVDGKAVQGEQVVLQTGSILEFGGARCVFVLIPESVMARLGSK